MECFQLFMLCIGSFTFFITPLMSSISRKHEYEADQFAVDKVQKPQSLISALVALNKDNLSNLHPHPYFSRWYYSHPTLLERLNAIENTNV